MRVKMIVAYDGTNYSGWQVQPNGITIEQKLNEALTALLKEEIKVTGASRTDAGVHSLGNVCIFDTTTRMPARKSVMQSIRDFQRTLSCRIPARWMRVFTRVFQKAVRHTNTGF